MKVLKVDKNLGLVFGFAIITKKDGADYYDLQGDHIPEDAMLEASTEFMEKSRQVYDEHIKKTDGQVLFAFPLTEEIAKSFNIQSSTFGLLIGMRPNDSAILEKYEKGEYTGFSIGGVRLVDEDVKDA